MSARSKSSGSGMSGLVTLPDLEAFLANIPPDVSTKGVTIRLDCTYKGLNFQVQSQGETGFYIKSDKGWNFAKSLDCFHGKLRAIMAARDKELADIAADKNSNSEDSEALGKLLDSIANTKKSDVWVCDKTRIVLRPQTKRFVITHGKRKSSSPLKPMMAVDKIVNFQIDKFTKEVVESIEHNKLKKAVLRCLARRGDRKDAALDVAQALDNIAGCHRKEYNYDRSWHIGRKTIIFDKEIYKFRIDGEWMLPLQTLDKIGAIVPAVAKQLANPNVWRKNDKRGED